MFLLFTTFHNSLKKKLKTLREELTLKHASDSLRFDISSRDGNDSCVNCNQSLVEPNTLAASTST